MVKASTWQQILHAGIGMSCMSHVWISLTFCNADGILILEHSFFLFQQKDPQPILSAAEKYRALDISAKVKAVLQDVSMQYSIASREEKIGMIFNVVMQNRMSKSHEFPCFILKLNIFISGTPVTL